MPLHMSEWEEMGEVANPSEVANQTVSEAGQSKRRLQCGQGTRLTCFLTSEIS
jgi:hypothetical protein